MVIRRDEFGRAAEAFGYFGDDLIVHMQDDRIARGLDPQHGGREHIAADRTHDVLGPHPPVRTIAMPAVAPLPGGVILEHHDFVVEILDLDLRERVGELARGGQPQEQVLAFAFEGDAAAADHLAAFAHRPVGRGIDVIPEPLDGRMCGRANPV